MLMPSGAGHDAMYMTNITDVGMIFIPSIDGVSHNIKEYSRMEDIAKGTELLLDTTLKLTQEE
jgi:acetylornithine deacetylase/succinyl-diaminopimelate desuccinylase-like protein